MKRYFKWNDDYIGGTTYIEICDDLPSKQIAVTSKKYIASNRKDDEYHFYLAEGKIDENEIIEYGGTEISEGQFYSIWNNYRNEQIDTWNQTKEKYPIGSEIKGFIEVLYPQGIIVNISQNVIGVADYIKCRDRTKPEILYPQHKIIGKVASYDETNMWLVIDDPIVF